MACIHLQQLYDLCREHEIKLGGSDLHADDDRRAVTVLTDDERPVVFYGDRNDPRRGTEESKKGP